MSNKTKTAIKSFFKFLLYAIPAQFLIMAQTHTPEDLFNYKVLGSIAIVATVKSIASYVATEDKKEE